MFQLFIHAKNRRQSKEKNDRLFRFLEYSVHWNNATLPPWHNNKKKFMEHEWKLTLRKVMIIQIFTRETFSTKIEASPRKYLITHAQRQRQRCKGVNEANVKTYEDFDLVC